MVTRVVLRDLLSLDPEVEVVAEVQDGFQAVTETCRLRPDLVILDIIMPVMDGLSAVTEIMATCPTPILILSANLDARQNRHAFQAIQSGALDVMEKPEGLVHETFPEIAAALVEKVKFLARIRVMHHFRRTPQAAAVRPPGNGGRRDILAIGASTGGPKAVMRLMRSLPAGFGARVLIVQHIATGFEEGFAQWLDRECALSVRLARQGERLEAGTALVAPSGRHLQLKNERIVLSEGELVNCCKPSVDVLFQSLADSELGSRVVAVLLTGMGRDGANGMVALKRRGGYNIAQDESSSAIFGMPRAAISLGAVHETLPIEEIPLGVLRLMGCG